MSNLGRKLLDKPYALWAVLFVLAPLCMVVYYAFTDTGGAFSLHSVSQIPSYLSTILLSVLYGLAATVICLLLGYPFAYLISKHAARRQGTVVFLVMLLLTRLKSANLFSVKLDLKKHLFLSA